jgi:hypothetical protein
MTTQYFGTDRAALFTGINGVTTGTSTTGRKIELVVDTTLGSNPAPPTRADVLRGLEAITNFILSNPSPFAQ